MQGELMLMVDGRDGNSGIKKGQWQQAFSVVLFRGFKGARLHWKRSPVLSAPLSDDGADELKTIDRELKMGELNED